MHLPPAPPTWPPQDILRVRTVTTQFLRASFERPKSASARQKKREKRGGYEGEGDAGRKKRSGEYVTFVIAVGTVTKSDT